MLTYRDFFDLSAFPHADLFPDNEWVWHALTTLPDYMQRFFATNVPQRAGQIAPTATLHGTNIFVAEGAVIEDHVSIHGPAIIGADCEVRQGAYLRGNCILAPGAVLGHAGEMKNSILLNGAKAPHFAYVGDSILGNDTNLGAGTKLSNLTVSSTKDASGKRPTIELVINGERIDTGLAKFGAIIGDRSQTGCNAVTNPGTLIGQDTLIYANASLAKGHYPDNSIIKLRQATEIVARH